MLKKILEKLQEVAIDPSIHPCTVLDWMDMDDEYKQ